MWNRLGLARPSSPQGTIPPPPCTFPVALICHPRYLYRSNTAAYRPIPAHTAAYRVNYFFTWPLCFVALALHQIAVDCTRLSIWPPELRKMCNGLRKPPPVSLRKPRNRTHAQAGQAARKRRVCGQNRPLKGSIIRLRHSHAGCIPPNTPVAFPRRPAEHPPRIWSRRARAIDGNRCGHRGFTA